MRNGKQLYRNPENARIAGVCSGKQREQHQSKKTQGLLEK